MKFRTHNDFADINSNMASLQGYIQARRCDLERVFGVPNEEDGDKITTHWKIQFLDGTVATIYDWKTDAPGQDDVYSWHIGGHVRSAVYLVHNAYREFAGLSVRSA